MITVAGAIEFASGVYSGQTDGTGEEQRDWTGEPYIKLLLEVSEALHDPADEDDTAQIAGVLSGVLRDSDTTKGALHRLGVPEQVIEAIISVTKQPNERYVDMVRRAAENPIGRKVLAAMVATTWTEARLATLDRGSAAFLRTRRDEALGILTGGRRAA